MDQIWLEVEQESRIFLESCFVLATYRNSFSKYGYFWLFFPLKSMANFVYFFPQKLFVHFALDSCFCCHSTKFHPKKKKHWMWSSSRSKVSQSSSSFECETLSSSQPQHAFQPDIGGRDRQCGGREGREGAFVFFYQCKVPMKTIMKTPIIDTTPTAPYNMRFPWTLVLRRFVTVKSPASS